MYSIVPDDFPEYHQQTKQKDATEEEFNALFKPLQPSALQKIIRFLSFVFTLGWLRIIIYILLFAVFTVALLFFTFIQKLFGNAKWYKVLVKNLISPISRLGAFFIKFPHIVIKGKVEPATRTLVVNHISFWDPVLMFTLFPSSYLIMAGAKNSFFMQALSKIVDSIFVDRSKSEGVTAQIGEIQHDYNRKPLVIFPEGKVTNGTALLGFRTGAFVSETPIQAVCVRYKLWFCSKKWATMAWLDPAILDYMYQFLSIPFVTVEFNILPPLNVQGKSPEEKAIAYQLQMANFLGVPAILQTNKAIFKKEE